MEVILKFSSEESEAAALAQVGPEVASSIRALDEWLRSEQKHRNRTSVSIETARVRLRDELESRACGWVLGI